MSIEALREALAQPDPPGERFNLESLEHLCFDDGIRRDVGEFPPSEILELVREVHRMTPVIVAALGWRSDRTLADRLVYAVDEYRRARRAAGIEAPAEKP